MEDLSGDRKWNSSSPTNLQCTIETPLEFVQLSNLMIYSDTALCINKTRFIHPCCAWFVHTSAFWIYIYEGINTSRWIKEHRISKHKILCTLQWKLTTQISAFTHVNLLQSQYMHSYTYAPYSHIYLLISLSPQLAGIILCVAWIFFIWDERDGPQNKHAHTIWNCSMDAMMAAAREELLLQGGSPP